MRMIATVLLVGALGLWGCDGGSGNGEGELSGTGDASSSAGERGSDGRTGEGTKGQSRALDEDERGSAEGALGLFVLHMQRGEFQDALLLADPESVGYGHLEQAVNALVQAEQKGETDGVSLETLMRAFMSRGWIGAVWEPVTVQEERARFELKLVSHEPRTLDLRKIDGEWYVMAPDWVIVRSDISDLVPNAPGRGPGGALDGANGEGN